MNQQSAASPTPSLMPFHNARDQRDAGIDRAEVGAECAQAGWGDKAMTTLVTFMRRSGVGATFQTVDVRLAAGRAESDPPEARAWGSVIRRAVRQGLIARHGYAPCNDPTQHLCPKTVWRVVALPA